MASAVSDETSSDVPDGLELELLVEITTEVDSQLPLNEPKWVELLMNTYDAKVRQLPLDASTYRLFHWIRKIAQLRQPGQSTWACFRSICEESGIELDFEPSFVDDADQDASQQQVNLGQRPGPEDHQTNHLTADTTRGSSGVHLMRETNGPTPRNVAVKAQSYPRSAVLLDDEAGADHGDDQLVEEVEIARRHLLRKRAFVAWRDYTISREAEHHEPNIHDEQSRTSGSQNVVGTEARSMALQHASLPSIRAAQRRKGTRSASNHGNWRSNNRQLEDITEEATLRDQFLKNAQQSVNHSTYYGQSHREQDTPGATIESHAQRTHLEVKDDDDDRKIPDADHLLQQARNLKAELYIELWRHKTQHKLEIAQQQLEQARDIKAELYFDHCRDRVHCKEAIHEDLFRQVKDLKVDLVFEQWNRHTRLFAVVEDNDRMYAGQFVNGLRLRAQRQKQRQRLVHVHKYEWACEHIWTILLSRRKRLEALSQRIEPIHYYRNVIEPFMAWRSRTKNLENERLALAYKEARRYHKMCVVSARLRNWQDKVAKQHILLSCAQDEMQQLRELAMIELFRNHLQKQERLRLLVPIAREQMVLLLADACVEKLRDRARQWRVVKRIAEEMQRERKERVALDAFRRWRNVAPAVLSKRNSNLALEHSELALSDTDLEVNEPQTPMPMRRAQETVLDASFTPKTVPVMRFRNVHAIGVTPHTAARSPHVTARYATPWTKIIRSATGPASTTPRTMPAIRQQSGPSILFKTPRRARGPLFTDPVFFERLKEVMPEHALLDEVDASAQ